MKDFTVNMLEHRSTEWRGVSVQVIVDSCELPNTMTSMMVIGPDDLATLRLLKKPRDLDIAIEASPAQGQMMVLQWERDRRFAEEIADSIGKKIARHLCLAIAEGGKLC